jgi:hypothetical protein
VTRRLTKRRRVSVGRPFMPRGTRLNIAWQLEFKKADLWVGVYWSPDPEYVPRSGSLWLCLLPMVPLHVDWWPTDPEGVL